MAMPLENTSNKMLDAALEYGQREWPVIPLWWPWPNGKCACNKGTKCESPGKHPIIPNWPKSGTTDPDVIRQWWTKWPMANIGILTGQQTGLLLLDVDNKDDGPGNLRDLEQKHGQLPDTVEAITGSGGRHILFKYPANRKITNKARFHPGLDTRSDGGMFVAAPSIHASGRRYEWEVLSHPDDVELAECPEWLLNLMAASSTKVKALKTKSTPESQILDGERNSALTSLAGTMRRRGMEYDSILAALMIENDKRCQPPLDDQEVEQIVRSVTRYAPAADFANSSKKKKYPLTDLGNGERLIARYGHDLRYCHLWNKWLVWDANHWATDDTGEVNRLAVETVRNILHEAANEPDDEERKELINWERRSESGKGIREMLNLAKVKAMPVRPDDLDKNPMILNVLNGQLDLKTGDLTPHQRHDLISKVSRVKYDPISKCPTWEAFLNKVLGGNQGLIKFMQRVIGYTLTGDTREQCIFILHGTGSNGKSTLLKTVSALLGDDYTKTIQAQSLMARKGDNGISNDIATLRGARFAVAIESEENQRLAESLIKAMSGGDQLTARFLYGEFFSFYPQFKLFLGTNHRPNIRGTDPAIWRRIKLIPFNVQILDHEKDKLLPDKLQKELPGILNWALQGCLEWQQKGLGEPEIVQQATGEYKADQDTLSDFLKDTCVVSENTKVENTALRAAYEAWCVANGERPLTQKSLSARLLERGFTRVRAGATGTRVWSGLGLKEFDRF